MTYVIVLIVIVVFAAGLSLALRGRGGDGVDSFRRQIDALSPEARKPTVDQVKSAERDQGEVRPEPRDAAGDEDVASNGEDS